MEVRYEYDIDYIMECYDFDKLTFATLWSRPLVTSSGQTWILHSAMVDSLCSLIFIKNIFINLNLTLLIILSLPETLHLNLPSGRVWRYSFLCVNISLAKEWWPKYHYRTFMDKMLYCPPVVICRHNMYRCSQTDSSVQYGVSCGTYQHTAGLVILVSIPLGRLHVAR